MLQPVWGLHWQMMPERRTSTQLPPLLTVDEVPDCDPACLCHLAMQATLGGSQSGQRNAWQLGSNEVKATFMSSTWHVTSASMLLTPRASLLCEARPALPLTLPLQHQLLFVAVVVVIAFVVHLCLLCAHVTNVNVGALLTLPFSLPSSPLPARSLWTTLSWARNLIYQQP